MRKNNKGFTLVELLAAIVILGLLVLLGLPRLTDAILRSKDRVYVSDAKKLIAQTEYKVKVNSSIVELPSNDNECIVVGLKYLDASDFDSPPNDGEYLEDQSFCVIKNKEDKLEYSARLIEETKKGGFKGVKLSTSSSLDVDGGLPRVDGFTQKDMINSLSSSDYDSLKTYINNSLGDDYCSTISNVYNDLDLSSSSSVGANSAPKISSAMITSKNAAKNYNTLDARLTLKAEDDGGQENLKVCITKVVYADINDNSVCRPYNEYADPNTGIYTRDFDFSGEYSYDSDYDNTVDLYIVVFDGSKSTVRRKISYEIHKNEPPVIDVKNSTVTKLDGDTYNGTTAKLKLNVTDDITAVGDLMVCYEEDNSRLCRMEAFWKKYSEVFGTGNTTEIMVGNELDGSIHKINVYVKDEFDRQDSFTTSYQIYDASVPEFQAGGGDGTAGSDITIVPSDNDYLNVHNNGMRVNVSFKLIDKLENVPTNRLKVKISEVDRDGSNPRFVKTYSYRTSSNASYIYLFGSKTYSNPSPCENSGNSNESCYNYDGSRKYLKVEVYDSSNPSHSNFQIVYYDLYKNQAPKAEFVSYVVDPNLLYHACPPNHICSGRNSLNIGVTFKVEDDIDTMGDVKFCLSNDTKDCTNPDEDNGLYPFYGVRGPVSAGSPRYSFTKYVDYDFAQNSTRLFYSNTANSRELYLHLSDSYGAKSTLKLIDYNFYINEPPYLDSFDVTSANNDYNVSEGSKDILIKPVATSRGYPKISDGPDGELDPVVDDLSDSKHIAYSVYVNNILLTEDDILSNGNDRPFGISYEKMQDIIYGFTSESLDDYYTFDKFLNVGIRYTLGDAVYDGKTYEIKLVLTDEHGLESEYTTTYQIYNNKPPTIDSFTLEGNDPACDNCGNDSNGYSVYVNLKATDDLDSYDKLSVCLTEDVDSCSYLDFIPYKGNFRNDSGYLVYNYVFKGENTLTPYNGQTKTLYAVVKDSLGSNVYESIDYQVYTNQAPEVDTNTPITITNRGDTPGFNSNAVYFNSKINDDLGDLYEKVCYVEVDPADNAPISEYVCENDYKPYSEHYPFEIDVDKFNGQRYVAYAKIIDSYGSKVATTTSSPYTLSTDVAPVILSASGSYNSPNNPNGGHVVFKVKDYGDQYSVCVSSTNNSSGCSFNSVHFDGSDLEMNSYSISLSSAPGNKTYYLFAKDENNHISNSYSFKFNNYTSCSLTYENATRQYTYVSGDKISADKCSGRCYYWDEEKVNGKVVTPASDTHGIVGKYNITLKYGDAFNFGATCTQNVLNNQSVNCGDVLCFNNGKSGSNAYNNTVIGLEEYVSAYDWVYTASDGTVYNMTAGSRYYKVYQSQYIDGAEKITLVPTSQIIPIEDIDNYKFSPGENMYYIRAKDSDNITVSNNTISTSSAKIRVVEQQNAGRLTFGDRVELGKYKFHVLESNNDTTKLLADYNIAYGYVDGHTNATITSISGLDKEYGMPYDNCTGSVYGDLFARCVDVFSDDNYWTSMVSSYPANIENQNLSLASVYHYFEDYLTSQHINYNSVRLLQKNDTDKLGCVISGSASCVEWSRTASSWVATAKDKNNLYVIETNGVFHVEKYNYFGFYGFRYVVSIDTKEFNSVIRR